MPWALIATSTVGVSASFEEIVINALLLPTDSGVNVNAMVQLAPAATVVQS